jgi:hypothetical protein
MSNPESAAARSAPKPWWSPSLLAGPLFSFAFCALGLLALGWAPALLLLGFWLEELLTLVVSGIAAARLERRRGEKGAIAGVLALLFFPLLHLIFILVFLHVDSSSNPATDRLFETLKDLVSGDLAYALLDRASFGSILELLGFAIAAQIVELVRRRKAAARDPEMAELELGTRLKQALVLPHLTIIAGGGAMVMLHDTGAWMATGVLVAKAIAELLLFPAMRRSVERQRAGRAA